MLSNVSLAVFIYLLVDCIKIIVFYDLFFGVNKKWWKRKKFQLIALICMTKIITWSLSSSHHSKTCFLSTKIQIKNVSYIVTETTYVSWMQHTRQQNMPFLSSSLQPRQVLTAKSLALLQFKTRQRNQFSRACIIWSNGIRTVTSKWYWLITVKKKQKILH